MIAEFSRYREYKDSEQLWLGEIPSHWKLSRLGARLYERRETNERNEIQHVLSVMKGRGVIPYTEKGNVGNKRSDDIRRYKIVRPDDIVINCMNVIIGSLGISKYTGCLSPVYYVLRTRFDDDVPRYFNSVFQTANFHRSLVRIGNGILAHRMRIPMEKLKCEIIPVPPPEEQELIVRFLDWASVKLGKAIAAKRKVIGLLEEQKQAIIHRAVTRGLDDSVPLKPSGLDWLGNVPEHWDVVRAKQLFHQVRPPMPESAEQVTCFRDGQVTLRSNRRTTGFTNAIWELGYQGIYPGQLVLHSMDAFAGAIGVCDSIGKCSPEYVICEPSIEGLSPHYYGLLMRDLALRGLFVMLCPSVRERAPRVRYNDFGSFCLPVPSIPEQDSIVKHIHVSCQGIDYTVQNTKRQIELLVEYRTRLIADVVTGKLDVREFARTLPADIAEEAAELASSELGDEEFSDTDDELADELTGEPA